MAEDPISILVGLIAAFLILDLFFFGLLFPTEPVFKIIVDALGSAFILIASTEGEWA